MTTSTQPVYFTPAKNHRFLLLDALRGLAALFVVAFHFPKVMLASFAINGTLAVDFFFCLSGFVIAFSYENRLTKTLSFKDFVVARWIRLYPIYALGSIIGLFIRMIIQHLVFHSPEAWLSWSLWVPLFTLAFFLWPTRLSFLNYSDNYPLDNPAWSLFYEIFANLAYALLVKLRIARNAVLLCIVAGSLAVLVKVVVSGGTLDLGPRQAGFYLGFARVAFSFFFGILICRFYHSRPKNTHAAWTQWLLPVIITLALVGILYAPFYWMRTETFRLAVIVLCFPAMVYYGALVQLPHRFARFSAALGELSYPLYLLHAPFVLLMSARHLLQFAVTHTVIARCVTLCLIAIFAFVSWQIGEYVDLPIRRALTRRYNSYKQNKLTPISLQTPE
jgi:peptidoglycan/LPS O-acetylase OafA/YrhL